LSRLFPAITLSKAGGFFHVLGVLEFEDALDRVLAQVPKADSEVLPVAQAHGRFSMETVTARVDLPLFTNSSMDGYAVRSADTAGARPDRPTTLRLLGRVAAGSSAAVEVQEGQCVRVFTGSPVPAGADAVIMQEDTRFSSDAPEQIQILDSTRPGENVRLQGEDVRRATKVISAGQKITAARLCLLAASGVPEIAVGRRPALGVLATGSELREPGQELAPGQIYESNRFGLAALLRQAGAEVSMLPLVRDDLDTTRNALRLALGRFDIVVTTGGVSVGELDFIKIAFEEVGGELNFWKVAMKPGRPFVFGKWKEKLLFGLPGNPVSALVTYLLLVRPAVLRRQGASEAGLPASFGLLAEDIANDGGRRHFMRVRLGADGRVVSAGAQASHVLSSMAEANGLLDVPARTTLRAGAQVRVLSIND
jgi:molybdopterin molybdotransferase